MRLLQCVPGLSRDAVTAYMTGVAVKGRSGLPLWTERPRRCHGIHDRGGGGRVKWIAEIYGKPLHTGLGRDIVTAYMTGTTESVSREKVGKSREKVGKKSGKSGESREEDGVGTPGGLSMPCIYSITIYTRGLVPVLGDFRPDFWDANHFFGVGQSNF